MTGLLKFIKQIFWNLNINSTNHYLLEYRFSGYPKKYLLNRYFELKRTYRITHPLHHHVPHITIAGPIVTNNEEELTKEMQRIIFKNAHHFHKPGNLIQTGKFIKFETKEGGKVLAIKINPPESLINLKKEIESAMNNIPGAECQVYKEDIWHTTLWNMKNNRFANNKKFSRIWHNLKNNPQEMKCILDRLTLIKGGKILEEYDLIEKRKLNRIDSLDNSLRYNSYLKMKEKLKNLGETFKF